MKLSLPNKTHSLCRGLLILALSALGVSQARAQDLLRSAETTLFKESLSSFNALTSVSIDRSSKTMKAVIQVRFNEAFALQDGKVLIALLGAHRTQVEGRLDAEGLPTTESLVSISDDQRFLVYRRPIQSMDEASAAEREVLGLAFAARHYGVFNHDIFLGRWSGIAPSEIAKLREAVFTAKKMKRPLIVGVIMNEFEIEARDAATTPEQSVAKNESWVVHLQPQTLGYRPVELSAPAIVWHRNAHQAKSLVGDYNPALTNALFDQVLENKWVEYKFWNKYAPEAMPRAQLLSHFFSQRPSPEDVQAKLKTEFPDGYVLKGSWDFATGNKVISEKINLAEALAQYRRSDYDQYAQSVRDRRDKLDGDDFIEQLQNHPHYRGYRVSRLLKNYATTIVQERIDIQNEFRVEVVNGRVMRGEATNDRYQYLQENRMTFWDPVTPSKSETNEARALRERVENFAQSLFDRLPPSLRASSAGMDIAITKSGQLFLIEANRGPKSGYFAFRPASRRALESRILADYQAERAGSRAADQGLTPGQQIHAAEAMLRSFELDLKRTFPGFTITENDLLPPDLKPIDPSSNPKKAGRESLSSCQNVFR